MAQQPPDSAPFVAQVPLAGYTTLHLGGPARHFAEAADDTELVAQVWAADERGEPLLVLGGGSNLVVADEGFPGTVVRVTTRGIRHETDGDRVLLTVAAGEDWDTVVAGTVADGLAGLECLSGIPGLAGATPIQNVGAYSQDVAQTLVAVRGYDRERGEVVDLTAADCEFGYRTSAFKRSLRTWPQAQRSRAAIGDCASDFDLRQPLHDAEQKQRDVGRHHAPVTALTGLLSFHAEQAIRTPRANRATGTHRPSSPAKRSRSLIPGAAPDTSASRRDGACRLAGKASEGGMGRRAGPGGVPGGSLPQASSV